MYIYIGINRKDSIEFNLFTLTMLLLWTTVFWILNLEIIFQFDNGTYDPVLISEGLLV